MHYEQAPYFIVLGRNCLSALGKEGGQNSKVFSNPEHSIIQLVQLQLEKASCYVI